MVHCTATNQNASLAAIMRYWRENLGWKNPGYHYIIDKTGAVTQLLDIQNVANGVAGFNSVSIHISYIGGIEKNGDPIDNRTVHQKYQIRKLLVELKKKFPDAIIQGHRDFPKVYKDCPCFDAKIEYKDL